MKNQLNVYIFVYFVSLLFSTELSAGQNRQTESLDGFLSDRVEEQRMIERMLVEQNSPEGYRKHLYQLTQRPHIAGTDGSRDVINYMSRVMEEAGLEVEHYDYDAFMPRPGEVSVSLVQPIRLPLNNQEYILDEDPYTDHPELLHGWNAYSGSGNVSGEIVYANFGTREDFQRLEEMGIDVQDKIVIARYGGNFRGYKAKFAEEAGAAGLIIYTDPENGGYMSGLTYPEGRHSSESTIQRGSLLTLDYYGDPLTPFEPALPLDRSDSPERLDEEEVAFHTIPVAPIPYGSATEIFARMKGDAVPNAWQGGLPYTYRLTGGTELIVNVSVNQPKEYTRITNVTGMVTGSEYPDEWIILGSHHDAWGFGATDPNSGTAMLLTLAESLGTLIDEGYRPRRSIMIAHWDAEEFMLIGSSEWVEELKEDLHANAILYLNADMSVTGPNFRASASPSLKKAIIEATRVVPHPDSDSSVYETWIRPEQEEPGIGNLGGGSDHVGLYMHAGVPSAGLSISGSVPVYHSNYDSFHFYESFIDSSFHYGPALAGVYGVTSLRFANADILPYDLMRYATDVTGHVETIRIRADELERNIDTEALMSEVARVETLAGEITENIAPFLENNPEAGVLETINAEMISLERSFLEEEGLPFSRWQQSLYSSTDPWSGYASWMMPGIRYILEDDRSDDELRQEVQRFTQAVSRLADRMETISAMMQ
jgi:N-acetylated-alpha-linked acidic dipeptidase